MKEKFADGEPVLCMNLRLARSVDIAMIAKAGGCDAIYVDMQHAPYSIETTATICAAALGIGDPETGRAWPAMQSCFRALATGASNRAGCPGFVPDACLINRYARAPG
jgi:alkylated DNA repair dioxygenase AlkB